MSNLHLNARNEDNFLGGLEEIEMVGKHLLQMTAECDDHKLQVGFSLLVQQGE